MEDFLTTGSGLIGNLLGQAAPLVSAIKGNPAPVVPKVPATTPAPTSGTTYLLYGGGALLIVGLLIFLLTGRGRR